MMKSNVRKRKDILPLSPTTYQSTSSKKTSSKSIFENKVIIIIELIVIIFLIFTTIHYRSQSLETSNTLQIVYNKYNTEQEKWLNEIKEVQELRHKLESMHDIQSNNNNNPNNDNAIITDPNTNHDKDKDDWNDLDKQWIKDIQHNDYKSLKLQYGDEEPINVLIETSFGDIILEMAPIKQMPHTIRYYLTLIESKFWNGCHFFRNADHVIQANCHRRNTQNVNGLSDEERADKLGQTPSITFQEYDESLPYLHEKYSIGLAGRPGGPDFYINLVDNKRNHGPGGQGPKPDPCFANIVKGQDVIDRIHELEHDGSKMQTLKEWVEFKRVSVIKR